MKIQSYPLSARCTWWWSVIWAPSEHIMGGSSRSFMSPVPTKHVSIFWGSSSINENMPISMLLSQPIFELTQIFFNDIFYYVYKGVTRIFDSSHRIIIWCFQWSSMVGWVSIDKKTTTTFGTIFVALLLVHFQRGGAKHCCLLIGQRRSKR